MRKVTVTVIEKDDISQRPAYRLVRVDPTNCRARTRTDHLGIRERIRESAKNRRRFGYRRICIILERKGVGMNQKKRRRLYKEEGQWVKRRRRRKRATGIRQPMQMHSPSKLWSLDFVSDHSRELTNSAVFELQNQNGIHWHYIAPGKPPQNRFIDSFNGTLEDECSDE
jgi:putative transposase